ncbi:MAG: flagellar hook-length control protein FliK [Phycisphaerales bacterium]
MPQQVLSSPTPPKPEMLPQTPRERELRVQGDAGVFGLLLGALQAGDAGIVRGETRDDSAAEWNAKTSRETTDGRQGRRDGAQDLRVAAQESRDPGSSVAQRPAADSAGATPVAAARGEAVERGSRGDHGGRTERVPPEANPAEGQRQDTGGRERGQAPIDARSPQAGLAGAAASVAARAVSGGQGGTAAQPSPSMVVAGARGPQGGAAREGTPVRQAPTPSGGQRFDRVFEAQVSRGLARALRSGDGSVTLRLKPESLGQLSVRVQVQNQRVEATFEARTVGAQRMLEASRDVLRQQLEGRGLAVDRIEVRLLEEPGATGTRFAFGDGERADDGQEGRTFAHDRGGRGSAGDRGTTEDGVRGGAPREDDGPVVVAEPRRALGTFGLDAIA